MFLLFRGVGNQPKIGPKFDKKTIRKKHAPGQHFFVKTKKMIEKCSKTGPGTGGNEPRFSSLFRPWTPEGAPGAPKSAPGSHKGATGRDFLRFFAVFGWSRALFFDYFLSISVCGVGVVLYGVGVGVVWYKRGGGVGRRHWYNSI